VDNFGPDYIGKSIYISYSIGGNMKGDKIDLNSLELMFVTVLSTRELYGLEIIKAIEEVTAGKRRIGFGSLYPTLHQLEKRGLVKSRWGEDTPKERGGARRKYYRITAAGQVALREVDEVRVALASWDPALGRA
jgi:PadR family transcriptional regulator PadR